MTDPQKFDHLIKSNLNLTEPTIQNLAELIFNPLEHRNEKGEIILGHDNKTFVRLSLSRFRYIHLQLYRSFRKKNIQPGETILLAGIPANNELFQAILFSALSSYGVRVFMPMFMETNELDTWITDSDCRGAIVPVSEIHQLDHHEKTKKMVEDIVGKVKDRGLTVWDSIRSFEIRHWLYSDFSSEGLQSDPLVVNVIQKTNLNHEALIITTSGSTGKSKLVVYHQEAFIKSCLSWQMAGMLDKSKLGGRGFTPLFNHTMGIRTFINALWTGNPVCLINTEWFEEHPEIVRYFLLKMKPEHITGGPAAYKLLLEMTRNFPELVPTFREYFRTLVSSGSQFDHNLVQEIQSIFELPIQNAMGTTETQQVTNTLLNSPGNNSVSGHLGHPLPGVTLGLKRIGNGNTYHLFIKSPFGCSGILTNRGEVAKSEYFNSGDIVELNNGSIIYSGRDEADFFKDGFGVKIPTASVREYYREIESNTGYIEYYTLQGEPGLAALIFINKTSIQAGQVIDDEIISPIRSRIEAINQHLFAKLSPFEFRHRAVRRFTVLNSEPARTVKGNISPHQIKKRHFSTIQVLRKYFVTEDWVHTVKNPQTEINTFTEHANSYVGRYLRDLKMDYVYHRAEKDTLFTSKEGKEVEILDLVGGYGGNLLGHNRPELRETITNYLDQKSVSISNQGSIQNEVGLLAEKLNDIMRRETGRNFRVCLGSTGSEAVEMALHHAFLEWRTRLEKMEQRQFQEFGSGDGLVRKIWEKNWQKIESARLGVVTLKTAFHGHSSGARCLIGSEEQRSKFINMLALDSYPIDNLSAGWRDQLRHYFNDANIELTFLKKHKGEIDTYIQKQSTIIAAVAEPITGEGGIRKVNKDLLTHLGTFEFPLIIDEIQSGLGRSGNFLASKGVAGNYYLLGKSLGGGFEKISTLMVEKNRYVDEFGKYYSTTFGNGERAARVAREALTLIESLDVPALARQKGEKILNCLDEVTAEYPDVFEESSGSGLMLGIRFTDFSTADSIMLRLMHERELLGYVSASFLLNKHNIRVLPTLSAPNVLRVEPSAFITDEEILQLGSALVSLAEIIRKRTFYDLFLHFMEDDPFDDQKGYEPPDGLIYPKLDPAEKGAKQVTFLAHFTNPTDELRVLVPSFKNASNTGLRLLFSHLQVLMEMKPVTLFSKNLFEGRIHFKMKVIPLGSAALEQMHREKKKREIVDKIQQAVNEAAQEGSEIVALGGYTSIFSNNGLAIVQPPNTKVITGNTLTAASGITRLIYEMQSRPFFNEKCTLGIVGAAGNIGRSITAYMLKQDHLFKHVYLIVNSRKQLLLLQRQLKKSKGKSPLIEVFYSTNIESLQKCDAAIITTNSNNPIVFPHHIKQGSPVLISDNSIPTALSDEINALDNVSIIPFSSYLKLPFDPEFLISAHTPRGTAFCCAVEAMICALEEVNVPLRGSLEESSIQLMIHLAKKWQLFGEFGILKSFKSNAYT